MIPQPQAGTETAETAETAETLIDQFGDDAYAAGALEDLSERETWLITKEEADRNEIISRTALLSHIAAKEQTITAQAAAISELVEGLKPILDKLDPGFTGDHSNDEEIVAHARAIVAKHGGAA